MGISINPEQLLLIHLVAKRIRGLFAPAHPHMPCFYIIDNSEVHLARDATTLS
jgi:hypothetical protein